MYCCHTQHWLIYNNSISNPVIQINIRRCHSDGCDTRIRGIKAVGYRWIANFTSISYSWFTKAQLRFCGCFFRGATNLSFSKRCQVVIAPPLYSYLIFHLFYFILLKPQFNSNVCHVSQAVSRPWHPRGSRTGRFCPKQRAVIINEYSLSM